MTIEERLAKIEERLDEIEEQLEAAETNWSAAREEAHVVQAAASRQIRELEGALSDERADRERAERKQQRGW